MRLPTTFYDCLIVLVVLLLLLGQGSGFGGRLPDPNTLNVRRVAGGAAGVSLFAFVMVSAANDVHGFGQLAQFFLLLGWPLPLPLALALGLLALLLLVSLYSLLAGWRGPFPPRRSMKAGGEFLLLVAAAGVWLWGGLFLDERTSWLADWAHRWNFALTALLLCIAVHALASMAVLLANSGGGGRGPVDEERKRRSAPMVGARRRQY